MENNKTTIKDKPKVRCGRTLTDEEKEAIRLLPLPIYITTTESLRLFRRESPISEDLKRLLQQKDEASESDKPAT